MVKQYNCHHTTYYLEHIRMERLSIHQFHLYWIFIRILFYMAEKEGFWKIGIAHIPAINLHELLLKFQFAFYFSNIVFGVFFNNDF